MGNGSSCAKCGERLTSKEDWDRPRCRVHYKKFNLKTQKYECIDCYNCGNCFHRIHKRKLEPGLIREDKSEVINSKSKKTIDEHFLFNADLVKPYLKNYYDINEEHSGEEHSGEEHSGEENSGEEHPNQTELDNDYSNWIIDDFVNLDLEDSRISKKEKNLLKRKSDPLPKISKKLTANTTQKNKDAKFLSI